MVSFYKSWKTTSVVSTFEIFGNNTKLTVLYKINTKGFQKKFQQQESLSVKGHPPVLEMWACIGNPFGQTEWLTDGQTRVKTLPSRNQNTYFFGVNDRRMPFLIGLFFIQKPQKI